MVKWRFIVEIASRPVVDIFMFSHEVADERQWHSFVHGEEVSYGIVADGGGGGVAAL